MPLPPAGQPQGSCPFIDRDDRRCATQFSIRRLHQAFSLCLNNHPACPVYQQLAWEQRPRDTQPPIPHLADVPHRPRITVNGQAIEQFSGNRRRGNAPIPLRPTGS